MTTDPLATIDDTTLTTITGAGQSPWQQCLISGAFGSMGGLMSGNPRAAVIGAALGCAGALASHIPPNDKALPPPKPRPGFPYATESRL